MQIMERHERHKEETPVQTECGRCYSVLLVKQSDCKRSWWNRAYWFRCPVCEHKNWRNYKWWRF